MKKLLYWIAIGILAVGCKKEPENDAVSSPKTVVRTVGPIAFDSSKVIRYKYKPLLNFYRLNDYHTFWENEAKRKNALLVLADSYKLGFDPEFYGITRLNSFEKRYKTLIDAERVTYDILLTYSLRSYLAHVYEGQCDVRKLNLNWAIYRHTKPITDLMLGGIKGDSLSKVIRFLEPKHPVYKGLIKALAMIDALPASDFKTIRIDGRIRRGDSVAVVSEVKKRLIFWGDLSAKANTSAFFNSQTIRALWRFQKRHGLPVTGSLTKATVEALNCKPSVRRKQIVVNIERWRWFPHSMDGQYVIVNIPDYSLYLIKDKDTLDSRKVVVGKAERSTPVLTSTFNEIILNPTWTVPPTIIKEDLGPDAAKDTNYFKNHRLTIYDWKKKLVSPSKWDATKPNDYYYVQDPGSDNSLGNVKFNFPNNFMVYLHDTNHRDYFSYHKRSLSSGCVRVENPLPLAQQLINDEQWTLDKINEVVVTKETTSVKLKDKIKIYQLYWTAWLNNKGQIEFREDIYNLDEPLYAALRK
ncbi:L,D-transpeptidase family protein [Flavobacterium silvaticum]|uniref:L,D-transpeptidase family protein n=1 Tax=Flavobacterium silvaticum TaxID=1852020 RepID=A0A972JF19_9FLAO|nr:L,D-transpeptidase family protein [Flavobacterium silvaticum]NMH27494.1 L,D-transpeptidase family protein [Flavobacterium silvaticum]